jgi:hypothetical protein
MGPAAIINMTGKNSWEILIEISENFRLYLSFALLIFTYPYLYVHYGPLGYDEPTLSLNMYVMNLKVIKRERERAICRNRLFYRLRSRLQYKLKQTFLSTVDK